MADVPLPRPGSLCTGLGLIVVVIPVLLGIMSSSSAAQAPSHLDPFGPFALVPENYMIIYDNMIYFWTIDGKCAQKMPNSHRKY